MQAEKNDFAAIARENDGTFANVVLNLQRARKTKRPLSLANYTPTLDGSWRDVYERAVAKHSAVQYIYDAIDLLQRIEADLYPWLVEPTASLFAKGKRQRTTTPQRQIKDALKYLTQEGILVTSDDRLAPRDGQIEAKGYKVDWEQYLPLLVGIMLHLVEMHRKQCLRSLSGLSDKLLEVGRFAEALDVLTNAVQISPNYPGVIINLGIALAKTGHYEESESILDSLIAHFPHDHPGFHFEISALLEALGRNIEAEMETDLGVTNSDMGRLVERLPPLDFASYLALARYCRTRNLAMSD